MANVRPLGALFRVVPEGEVRNGEQGEHVLGCCMDDKAFVKQHGMEFSRFKFGDPNLAENYGKAIAAQIRTKFPAIDEWPSRYVILRPHAKVLPRSGTLLWDAICDCLSTKDARVGVGLVRTTRHAGVDYAQIGDKRQRLDLQRSFGLTWDESFSSSKVLTNAEVVIFVDDTIVSGGTMVATREVLSSLSPDQQFVAFTIVDLTASNFEFEGELNELAFRADNASVVPQLAEHCASFFAHGSLPAVKIVRFILGAFSAQQRKEMASIAAPYVTIWLLLGAFLDDLYSSYAEPFSDWIRSLPQTKAFKEGVAPIFQSPHMKHLASLIASATEEEKEVNVRKLADLVVDAALCRIVHADAKEAAEISQIVRHHRHHCMYDIEKTGVEEFVQKEGVVFDQFKFGYPAQVDFYAERLCTNLCAMQSIFDSKEGVELVTVAAAGLPKATTLLVERMVDILKAKGKPVAKGFMIVKKNVKENYAGTDSSVSRLALVRKMETDYDDSVSEVVGQTQRTVVFVDDTFVSGATYVTTLQSMMRRGVALDRIHALGILRIFNLPGSTEGRFNEVYFNPKEKDDVLSSRIVEGLNAQFQIGALCVIRALRFLLGDNYSSTACFALVVSKASPELKKWLCQMAIKGNLKDSYPDRIEQLES